MHDSPLNLFNNNIINKNSNDHNNINDSNDKSNNNSDFVLFKEEYQRQGEITCNLYFLVQDNTFTTLFTSSSELLPEKKYIE